MSSPLATLDLELQPTIAMVQGRQAVFGCANCGCVVVRTSLATRPSLGPCPACDHTEWTQQGLPVAGLHHRSKEPR